MPQITNPSRPVYSSQERALLERLFPLASKAELLAALPTRTWPTIQAAATRFGIRRQLPANYSRQWSVEHAALVKEHYPSKGAEFVSKLVGRPMKTVLSYAGAHGIRREYGRDVVSGRPIGRPPKPTDWPAADIALLRTLYPSTPRPKLLVAFPTRKWTAIKSQASRLGIARERATGAKWSEQETALLQANYAHASVVHLQELLPGRTLFSIRIQAHKLKLARAPRPRAAKPVAAPKPAKVVAAKVAPARKKAAPKVVAPPAPKPLPAAGHNDRQPSTPVLNAQKAQRQAAEKAEKVKPVGFVSAEQIRALPAAHPARLAFTRAAYHGPEAAAKAFHEAMKQAA